jgi:hypothetical protein
MHAGMEVNGRLSTAYTAVLNPIINIGLYSVNHRTCRKGPTARHPLDQLHRKLRSLSPARLPRDPRRFTDMWVTTTPMGPR